MGLRKMSGRNLRWTHGFGKRRKMEHRFKMTLKQYTRYLAPSYWLIYLSAFCIGFYLFGRGSIPLQLTEALFGKKLPISETGTLTMLQHEVKQLKRELHQLSEQSQTSRNFSPEQFARPAPGKMIRGEEWVLTDNVWRLHSGADIGLPLGSNVMAAADGNVVKADSSGDGLTVNIAHGNGWESVYSYLGKISVRPGEKVRKGQIIGTSGVLLCTKTEQPGFHFGIFYEQEAVAPEKIIAGLKE